MIIFYHTQTWYTWFVIKA